MQDTYTIKYYVLVYLDLLDQARLLKTIDEIPIDSVDSRALHVEALRSTVGKVQDFHESFCESIDEFVEQCKIPKSDVHIKRYSDSVLLYTPVQYFQDPSVVSSLLDVLCDFLFSTIAAAIPCRGSVAFGKGVELVVNSEEEQIYGPVLARAVDLEKKGEYPSIIVDEEFVRLYVPGHQIDQYLYYDDRFRVNPVSDSVRRNLHFEEFYRKAVDFVEKSLFDFREDPKLLGRYQKLKKTLSA